MVPVEHGSLGKPPATDSAVKKRILSAVLLCRRPRQPPGSFLGQLAELVHELALVGEFAGLELGIHQLAVDGELETTATRWNQSQALHLLLVGSQNSVRQTDGLRLIASHRAVF